MELFQLTYFLEVAKTQHVTKSAQVLHVSQSALTQAMHKLESELGVSLFEHKGRNIALTPCGTFFYDQVRPIVARLKQLPAQVKALEQQERRAVRVNILAAEDLVSEVIMEYQRIDNEFKIEVIQNAQADDCDITVETHDPRLPLPPVAKESARFSEQIYLAVPNVPRYRGRKNIALSEVQDEKCITLASSQPFRAITQRICERAGVRLHSTFESDSPTAVKNMIAARMGIGFWPAFSWGAVNPQRVLLLPIDQPDCTRDIIISYHPVDSMEGGIGIHIFYEFLCRSFALKTMHT